MSSRVHQSDLEKVRHMLGVSPRTPDGYRNHFVAGADDVAAMERLRDLGLVVKRRARLNSGEMPLYHATPEGARAVGLRELPR